LEAFDAVMTAPEPKPLFKAVSAAPPPFVLPAKAAALLLVLAIWKMALRPMPLCLIENAVSLVFTVPLKGSGRLMVLAVAMPPNDDAGAAVTSGTSVA
jgi:hypothetical protein